MSDRERKEEKLRHNVEVNTARAIQGEQERLRRSLSESEKAKIKKEFQESARRVDKYLSTVWNG